MQKNPYDNNKIGDRLEAALDRYSDMLFRIAFNMLGSIHDAEDATQETYLRYMKYEPEFDNGEHEKRWLVRVLINICKNMRVNRSKRRAVSIDELANLLECRDEERLGVLESIMSLPEKYRTVMDLHYVEGIRTDEIASMLSISPAAVRKRLEHGRRLLRIALEDA